MSKHTFLKILAVAVTVAMLMTAMAGCTPQGTEGDNGVQNGNTTSSTQGSGSQGDGSQEDNGGTSDDTAQNPPDSQEPTTTPTTSNPIIDILQPTKDPNPDKDTSDNPDEDSFFDGDPGVDPDDSWGSII